MRLYFYFHKGTRHNSLQKAGLFSRCMIFSKKKQDTAVFAGSAFQKVSVALSCVTEKIRKCITVSVYCFPASVLLFFNNAAFLRQNIDDAWKRFRFNPS